MIRVSSLDFLNKDFFDIDIMAKDGSVLFSQGEAITPEILLHLYFREIYVAQDLVELELAESERLLAEAKEREMLLQLEAMKIIKEQEEIESKEAEKSEEIEEIVTEHEEPLEFDEVQAQRVAQYALKLAQSISLPKGQQDDIEKAAYYHKVGAKRFTTKDLSVSGYRKKLAEASYDIIKNELNLPERIAEVAKFCIKRYDSIGFKLDAKFRSNIPYAHIVAIASYYDELAEKMSKEQALDKMMQIGGNRFNIFVLHKFIKIMR